MSVPHINFCKVPIKLFNLGLSSDELSILCYLFSLSNNEVVHPSRQTISDSIGLCKRSVDKIVKLLVKKGFLEYNKGYVKDTKKVCNQYRIRLENIDPTCIIKNIKQTQFENNSISECNEMIRQSVKEYNN